MNGGKGQVKLECAFNFTLNRSHLPVYVNSSPF